MAKRNYSSDIQSEPRAYSALPDTDALLQLARKACQCEFPLNSDFWEPAFRRDHYNTYFLEHQPVGISEGLMVDELALAHLEIKKLATIRQEVITVTLRNAPREAPEGANEMTSREHPEFKAMTLSMLWRDNPELYKRFERSDRFWRRCFYEASAELRRLRKERNAKPRLIDGPPAKPSGGITPTLRNVAQLAIAPLLLLLFHLAGLFTAAPTQLRRSRIRCAAAILKTASNYRAAILTAVSGSAAAILITASNQLGTCGRRFRLPRTILPPPFAKIPRFPHTGTFCPTALTFFRTILRRFRLPRPILHPSFTNILRFPRTGPPDALTENFDFSSFRVGPRYSWTTVHAIPQPAPRR